MDEAGSLHRCCSRNKDFPSFLRHFFFVVLCFCFGRARRRKEKITTPQAPGGEDPKHPRVENTQTHFTRLDLTVSRFRPGASSGKPGPGSNNPIVFCSLASSLPAKYFRRWSLFFSPAHREQKHPPEANSHPVFVPQTLFCSRETPRVTHWACYLFWRLRNAEK